MNVTIARSRIGARVSRRHVLAAMAGVAPALVFRRTGVAMASRSVERSGDFSGQVDIGGRSLWMECRGAGEPIVVLEAGSGNNGMIWDTVALDPGSLEVRQVLGRRPLPKSRYS